MANSDLGDFAEGFDTEWRYLCSIYIPWMSQMILCIISNKGSDLTSKAIVSPPSLHASIGPLMFLDLL